jgi:hypothetical protein
MKGFHNSPCTIATLVLALPTPLFMQLLGFGAPTSRTQHLELEALMQTTPLCLELGRHVTSKERSWICCCTKQKLTTIEYSTSLVWIHHFFANQLASANVPHLYQTTLIVVIRPSSIPTITKGLLLAPILQSITTPYVHAPIISIVFF